MSGEIITKGSWYTAPHLDYCGIGGYSIIPHFLEGVCKIWFLSTKKGHKMESFLIDHKLEVPLIADITRILGFVEKDDMEVIMQRPGEVMRLPSSTVHAVLTVFDPHKNQDMLCVMISYYALTSPSDVPSIRDIKKEVRKDANKRKTMEAAEKFVKHIFTNNAVEQRKKSSSLHGDLVTTSKNKRKANDKNKSQNARFAKKREAESTKATVAVGGEVEGLAVGGEVEGLAVGDEVEGLAVGGEVEGLAVGDEVEGLAVGGAVEGLAVGGEVEGLAVGGDTG